MKIDWCGSNTITFTIDDNGTKDFEITAFWNSKIIMPICLALVVGNIIASAFFSFPYLGYAFIPIIPFILYLFTFGRNKYLTLKEIW